MILFALLPKLSFRLAVGSRLGIALAHGFIRNLDTFVNAANSEFHFVDKTLVKLRSNFGRGHQPVISEESVLRICR